MAIGSRSTTPLSSTTTLSLPPSPSLKDSDLILQNVFNNPKTLPSNIIEFLASRSSSTVYVYDLAEQMGFGNLAQSWTRVLHHTGAVVSLQTRAGAGLSLVGRLSEGSSRDAVKGTLLTAFTTPSGLSLMAESLLYLPPASLTSRLILQIPTTITLGETLAISPSLAPLATFFSTIPPNIVVFLSATPQEAVDLAALSYKLPRSHVIHLFDHHSCCREIGHAINPPISFSEDDLSVSDALSVAGYAPFDYAGDRLAHTVIVLLNGPLALAAKALASQALGLGLGVVVVRVLRPWHESDFLQILPITVKHVHAFDDVPNAFTQGNLYADVFSTLLNSALTGTIVSGHRIVPEQTKEYLAKPASFTQFISDITSLNNLVSFENPKLKKLLFFSAAGTPLSALPHIIHDTFIRDRKISARLLTDHDVCSKPDTIIVDRMLLSQDPSDLPIPVVFPLDIASSGESDFLGVFDYTLLMSHSILKYAKPGSQVLVVTPWSSVEFATKVSHMLSLVVERNLHIFLIDAKDIAAKLVGLEGPTHDAMHAVTVQLAFLRLYLGHSASEPLMFKIARFMFEDVIQGVELTKINARAWAGLVEVDLSANDIPMAAPINPPLKEYQFNAITIDRGKKDPSAVARSGTWHDVARHILFPSVFTPPTPQSIEEFPQISALHPDSPDRTFLVTCTVNRRLTPLEYDRNVFHLEFDTTGTGLKYAIGEALGVHGWNDEQEVLAFCEWYGVDPGHLVAIPIAGGEGKLHTRTVLQALQQHIDLFGRPPKSFYSDLSAYATTSADKLALQFIGSPEGSATFKKLSEKDTVTFAEVLSLYPSARPGIETLCELVGDIKPRHYSIASAQAVVGDRVDLLVVSVNWLAPNGDPFFFYPTHHRISMLTRCI
jgi:sulfite reductase (NADPH) flavoprotein alpha-component